MLGLGAVLAGTLALAHRRLHVKEDPRIDAIEELLPQNNCGACGTGGCRAFAEAIVSGTMAPGKCTVSPPEIKETIALYLGVDVGAEEKRVARLACAGGKHVAWIRARYEGFESCHAAALIAGGGKGCSWGCLGFGDCQNACDFGAITMNEFGLPVVNEDRCTACNACVEVCPKALFSLHPISHRLWVACKNRAPEDQAKTECEVACIACGRCSADAPQGLVEIEDNLAVVDYGKNTLASKNVIQRCPTGAIVWIEESGTVSKGPEARKVARKSPLPIAKETVPNTP